MGSKLIGHARLASFSWRAIGTIMKEVAAVGLVALYTSHSCILRGRTEMNVLCRRVLMC